MLKTLLAGLFVHLSAAPTYTESEVRVGMTKAQVTRILGESQGAFGIGLGPTSNTGITFETCRHDGVVVEFSGGVVKQVKHVR